ncbi:MAG: glycosyltransferase [Actinomycetota bacterium]|nr:glycosyltransferase [Actinomycetota bacterium]
MRILLWHVHGSWTTAFVQGAHDYVLPVLPDRGPDGLGRARTWRWPASVLERTPAELAEEPVDVVVLQRPAELDLAARWLGRRPGRDVPAVYLEHNAPEPHPVASRHVMAAQRAVPIVHVTHFNRLCWDSGQAPTFVVEHGVVDPGERYTGEVPRGAVVVNEPVRRGRMVGTDLLDTFVAGLPLDVFGLDAGQLPRRPGLRTFDRLPDQEAMHAEVARRRLYLHPVRWTSLGLSLIESMLLGLPVVALATTEVVEAVPPEAGIVSTDVARLVATAREFVADAETARVAGKAARRAALERYGLARFLSDWDRVLSEVVR